MTTPAFTTSNRLPLPGPGAMRNTWGPRALNPAILLADEAFDGVAQVAVADDMTLTVRNGASDQARNRVFEFTGSVTRDITVTIPDARRWYWVVNLCSGSGSLSIGTATGIPVRVPNGAKGAVRCDGRDCTALTALLPQSIVLLVPTGPVTLTAGDQDKLVYARHAVTLPASSSVPPGWACIVRNATAYDLTVTVQGDDVIDSTGSASFAAITTASGDPITTLDDIGIAATVSGGSSAGALSIPAGRSRRVMSAGGGQWFTMFS